MTELESYYSNNVPDVFTVNSVNLLEGTEAAINDAMPMEDDLATHTLIIREGKSCKSYACLQCKTYYENVDVFNMAHNIPVTTMNAADADLIEEPLWQALPSNVQIIEDHADEAHEDASVAKHEENQEVENFCCVECGAVFQHLETAEQHLCTATNYMNDAAVDVQPAEPNVGCEICGTVFTSIEMFKQHQQQRPECAEHPPLAVKIECTLCGRIFGTMNALNSHMRVHNLSNQNKKLNNQKYVCEICNTIFQAQRSLDLHRKIHDARPVRSIEEALPAKIKQNYSQGDQFYCEICDKTFDSNLLLVHKNMHLNIAADAPSNTCGICNREFFTTESYKMHMQLHAGNLVHKHAQIENNKRTSNGSGQYACQYCGRNFKRAHEKVIHERVHTGEKPYGCEVCGKRFRVSYSLTLHLRTHTDVRPYQCGVCQKRFKSQPTYAHHIRIHTNEQNFKCEMCGKGFNTAVQLCAHRKSHLKPFVCTSCNRAFSTLYMLRAHMQSHHNDNNSTNKRIGKKSAEKPTCHICGAMYARNINLRQHLKTQHGLEEISGAHVLSEHLDSHEIDLEDPHFLSPNEEVVVDAAQFEQEQTMLLIAAADAAEESQSHNKHDYNAEEVQVAEQMIANFIKDEPNWY